MNYKDLVKPDAETIDLIRKSGDNDLQVAMSAQLQLARSFEQVLRQGVLVGDIVRSQFTPRQFNPGDTIEFPLDLLAPGEEVDHVAYTNPGNGRIPERQVEADYIQVPCYGVANSIDWLLRHAKEARWDLVGRAMQIYEAGFVKKLNDDGWRTILSAAADRNVLVFDADASGGQFTKRLVSLMKVIMRRNGGGNTASVKRGKLTDIFISPEGLEDIRNWGLDQLDDASRREAYVSVNGVTKLFDVNLTDLDELGENQEYQTYFTSNLGGTLNTGDLELVIGLDKMNNDSFLMPIKEEVTVFPDPALHRQQRAGVYGWGQFGFAVLDTRRVIAGSF